MSFKIPLAVYVIWHPNYIEGKELANYIYTALCRDANKPLVRTLGIPVYFRSVYNSKSTLPLEINFGESNYTAVVALISKEFLLDQQYKDYLDAILNECDKDKKSRRLYPVALSSNAYNVTKNIAPINFIRVNNSNNLSTKENQVGIYNQIKSSLLHELCRLLLEMKKASEENETFDPSPPIRLFISHSKHDDSKAESIKFRNYINQETQLKTFFDVNDIAFGYNFGDQIKSAAKESALVVFQSDSYSDREWCRIEVLTAKSAGCPVVIVNAVEKGEKRTFPYMGNYPSIRLKGNFEEIISLTLEQILGNLFTHRFLNNLISLYKIEGVVTITHPPELFSFIQLREKSVKNKEDIVLVIYPDPPLGSEETEILNKLDDDFLFITPIMLPSISQ